MSKFKAGDVVVLKEQPRTVMVIDSQHSENTYQCRWFNGSELNSAVRHEDDIEMWAKTGVTEEVKKP